MADIVPRDAPPPGTGGPIAPAVLAGRKIRPVHGGLAAGGFATRGRAMGACAAMSVTARPA